MSKHLLSIGHVLASSVSKVTKSVVQDASSLVVTECHIKHWGEAKTLDHAHGKTLSASTVRAKTGLGLIDSTVEGLSVLHNSHLDLSLVWKLLLQLVDIVESESLGNIILWVVVLMTVELHHDLFDVAFVLMPDGLLKIPMPEDAVELTALGVAVLAPAVVILSKLVFLAVNPLAFKLVRAALSVAVVLVDVSGIVAVVVVQLSLHIKASITFVEDMVVVNHAPEVAVHEVRRAVIMLDTAEGVEERTVAGQ